MKLIISSSELLKGIMAVAKAIPAKSALPILENFLFDLKGNILEITASDTELTLRTQIEVESTTEEGRIAVPAKHMMDLLKELPDQPLTINTSPINIKFVLVFDLFYLIPTPFPILNKKTAII